MPIVLRSDTFGKRIRNAIVCAGSTIPTIPVRFASVERHQYGRLAPSITGFPTLVPLAVYLARRVIRKSKKQILRRLWMSLFVGCASLLASCAPRPAPVEPPAGQFGTPEWGRKLDALTARVADAVRRALPGHWVEIKRPMTLAISEHAGSMVEIHAGEAWFWCLPLLAPAKLNQPRCDEAIDQFVKNTVSLIQQREAPISATALRLIVRRTEQAQALAATHPANEEPVEEPLFGDLSAILTANVATRTGYVTASDLTKLGITPAEAWRAARQNARIELFKQPIKFLPGPGQISPVSAIGNPYAPSGLALHDAWRPVESRLPGALVVAVPAADTIWVGDALTPADIAAVAARVRTAFASAKQPVSPTVFRWTADSWQIVANAP